MKELIVIFLIVLVIYLNQTQGKTQKGGATATTVGMGLVITAVRPRSRGYFAYKELSGPSPSPPDDDSGDTGSSGNVGSGSSKKRKKKAGDVINNYYFTDVGEDVIHCAGDNLCPGNIPCPASGRCPPAGGGGGDSSHQRLQPNRNEFLWEHQR